MRINSISSLYFKGNEINFSSVKESGFKFMEIRCDDILSNDNPEETAKIRKLLDKNSIEVSSVHSFINDVDISSEDKWTRTKSVRELEKSVAASSRLKSKYVVAHLSWILNEQSDRGKLLKNSLSSIVEARDLAEKMNVEILCENLLPDMLFSREDEAKAVVDSGFSLCFDLGHAVISKIDPYEFCRTFKKQIKLVHAHFNNSVKDTHSFIRNEADKEMLKRVSDILDESVVFVHEIHNEKKLEEIYLEVKDI